MHEARLLGTIHSKHIQKSSTVAEGSIVVTKQFIVLNYGTNAVSMN